MRKTSAPFILFALNVTKAVITGASIAASKPSRKQVQTSKRNRGFPPDLSDDEDNENMVRGTEHGKHPIKNKYSAHEEPNSGLGGEAILEEQGEEDFGTNYSIRLERY